MTRINGMTKKAKRWTWNWPKNKPKKPLNAYNLFFQEKHLEIMKRRSATPGKKYDRLVTVVGSLWKASSDNEKNPMRTGHLNF
jgi:HMG (high mobility group) box